MATDQGQQYPLKVCTWNCRGIEGHRNKLELFLHEEAISILMLQETFLKPHQKLYIKGCRIFRKDQDDGPKGSVALCTKSNICSTNIPMDTKMEAVAAELFLQGKKFRAISVYQPSPKLLTKKDIKTLTEEDKTLIGGDFNAKHQAWGSRRSNPAGRTLFRIITQTTGINIWAPEDNTTLPTMRTAGDILDIFISSRCKHISQIDTFIKLQVASDHLPVVCTWGFGPTPVNTVKLSTQRQKFKHLSADLGVTRAAPITNSEIEAEAHSFQTGITDLIAQCTTSIRINHANHLNLNSQQKALIQNKNNTRYRWIHHRRIEVKRMPQKQSKQHKHKEEKWFNTGVCFS